MKKIESIAIVLLMVFSGMLAAIPASASDPGPMDTSTGTPRVVLAELYTDASVAECVEPHQAMQMVEMDYERNEVVVLAWHANDALSFSEGNDRIMDLGISEYPTAVFDGVQKNVGGGTSVDDVYLRYVPHIQTRAEIASDLEMTVEWEFDTESGEGSVWVNVTAVETPSLGTLKLHTVVFENNYGPYDGGNGELRHDFVARDMLESQGAAGAPLTISKGEDLHFAYSFDASSYAQDMDMIGVMAFVQSHATSMEVLQAAYVNAPVLPNVAPVLSNAQVDPAEGATEDDEVTFKVYYQDTDDTRDEGPTEAMVFYQETSSVDVFMHMLVPEETTNTWAEGKWMTYTTTLDAGTYNYRFNATDGEDFATGDDDWSTTPVVISPRNNPPELDSAAFAPPTGDTTTMFRFDVMYRDEDDQPAESAKIVINSVEYDMSTDNTGSVIDWVPYYYESTLSVGDSHEFYFVFSDGIDEVRYPSVDAVPNYIVGPVVEAPNDMPTLTTPVVDPDEGTRKTDFEFRVTYTDGENDPPTIPYVYIDGMPSVMSAESSDYTSGVEFTYTTKLDVGTHNYYFSFKDPRYTVRLPETGTFEGPTVTNHPPEAIISTPAQDARFLPTEDVEFSAQYSKDPEGDLLDYLWESDIDGELSHVVSFNQAMSEGMHTITLTVTDEYGASDTATVNIEVRPAMADLYIKEWSVSNETPRAEVLLFFDVIIGNDGELPAIDVQVKFFVDTVLVSTETTTVEVDSPMPVMFSWVAVEGLHHCLFEVPGDNEGFELMVEPNDGPEPLPGEEPGPYKPGGDPYKKPPAGKPITFYPNIGDPNNDDLTYQWDFGDGTTSYEENPSHTYGSSGTYTVTVTATDSHGAQYTTSFDVQVTKPKDDEPSPGFGALLAASAMLLAILGAAWFRRRQ